MKMTLYGMPVAPNPRRVILSLHALGDKARALALDYQQISIPEREHLDQTFLSKNPFGQLPVLESPEDNLTLSDSAVISRYLCRVCGDEQLFGSSIHEQARIELMLRRVDLEVTAFLMLAFQYNSKRWADIRPQHPEFAQTASHRAMKSLGLIGDQLEGPYLLGDQPCFADIALYSILDFATQNKGSVLEHPAIKSWYELMHEQYESIGWPD